MAAVAVFGLVYVAVARAAIGGLGIEGDAERRFRASLLADRLLGEAEVAARAGEGLPRGPQDGEEGEFFFSVEAAPLDPAAIGLAEALATEERESGREEAPLELLEPSGRAGAAPLSTLTVRVEWTEPSGRQQVTRTTFLFDGAAAGDLLGELETSPPDGSDDPTGQPTGRAGAQTGPRASPTGAAPVQGGAPTGPGGSR